MLKKTNLNKVAILASITGDGKLERFDEESIKKKLAALSRQTELQLIFVANDQERPQEFSDKFIIRKAATFDMVLDQINGWFGPQQYLRERAAGIFNEIKLINQSANDSEFLNRIFQELFLIEPLKRGEQLTSLSDPGYISKVVDVNGQQKTIIGRLTTLEQLLLEQSYLGMEQVPRLILFGEQGGGKSAYLKFIGKNLAEGKLSYNLRVGIFTETNYIAPLFIDCSAWFKSGESNLYSFILGEFKSDFAFSEDMLKAWISHGDLFLLIDHIDKVFDHQDKLGAIIDLLNLGKTCPALIACNQSLLNSVALVSFVDYKQIFLSSLSDYNREAYIRAYYSNFEGTADSVDVIDQLDTLLEQSSLTKNPLLLSLLCLIGTKVIKSGDHLPKSRFLLYKELVDFIMSHYFGNDPDKELDTKNMLSLYAYAMIDSEVNGTSDFDYECARDKFDKFNACHDHDRPYQYSLNQLKSYNEELNYFFLENISGNAISHFRETSFKYYFATRWIKGLDDEKFKVWIGKFAERADDKDLLVFLAGRKREVIYRLTDDPKKDDLFLHRAALAALCIREVNTHNSDVREAQKQVSERIFDFFFNQSDSIIEQCEHIKQAVACLLQIDTRYKERKISAFIIINLMNPDLTTKIETLSQLFGHHAPPDTITNALSRLLGSEKEDERHKALSYINSLGASLVKSTQIQGKLIDFLESGKYTKVVLSILSKMGKGVTEKERLVQHFTGKINQINEVLRDDDKDKRGYALGELRKLLDALGFLGICQVDPNLTELLFELLGNVSLGEERIYVARVVAEMDLSLCKEEQRKLFIKTIIFFRESPNEDIRGLSGHIIHRALLCTRDLPLVNPLIKYISISRPQLKFDYPREIVEQDKKTFLSFVTKNNPKGLLKYWYQLGTHQQSRTLSDEKTIEAMMKWLCCKNEDLSKAANDILSSLVELPDRLVDRLVELYCWGILPDFRITALRILGTHIKNADSDRVLTFIKFNDQQDEVLAASLNYIKGIRVFNFDDASSLLGSLVDLLKQPSLGKKENLHQLIVSTLLRVLYIVVDPKLGFDEKELIDYAYQIAFVVRNKEQFPLVDEIVSLDKVGFRFYAEKEVNWKSLDIVTFRKKLIIKSF